MSAKQGTVQRVSPAADQPGTDYLGKMGDGTYALGSSDDALALKAYDTSPILKGTYNDTKIKALLLAELTGLRSLNPDFSPGPDGSSGVYMNYELAPHLADVRCGSRGLPATSFGPTCFTPNDLTTNASSLTQVVSPAAESSRGTLGSTLSPSDSSSVIADLTSAMTKGKSNYSVSIEGTTSESS